MQTNHTFCTVNIKSIYFNVAKSTYQKSNELGR